MRILLIKMSSMGDVFHTFPALSDAQMNQPGLVVDWVVEKGFCEIPKWHPIVDRVYAIELRKWRKQPFKFKQAIKTFFKEINQTHYDLIIDAQGLYKSLWVGKKVNAPISGFDFKSAREPLVSLLYQKKYRVAKDQHAILRLRQLFANALDYPLVENAPMVYGLNTQAWSKPEILIDNIGQAPYWVFLHGTTWETKYWPESYWQALLQKVIEQGASVVIPWGNKEEQQRAKRIAGCAGNVWVPDVKLSLNEMAIILNFAQQVVSVDTGLSHVAAALEVPMVVLYRVTDPRKIGALGTTVIQLSSPVAKCYVKNFKDHSQESLSLTGIGLDDVLKRALKQ